MPEALKPVGWISSSRKDLRTFPEDVKDQVGVALYRAQQGKKHAAAKPLLGFSGAGVLEVIADHDGDTYRAVYTVRFADIVYVLHCFQKKSKSGISAPRHDIELVKGRMQLAEQEYRKWRAEKK
jgi:phage-related protein